MFTFEQHLSDVITTPDTLILPKDSGALVLWFFSYFQASQRCELVL